MLNFLAELLKNIKDVVFEGVYYVPTAVSFGCVFYNVWGSLNSYINDCFILIPETNDDLFLYDNALYSLKTDYIGIINGSYNNFNIFLNNNALAEDLFKKLKEVILHHKNDNFSFFLSNMKGPFKEKYLDLFNSINENTKFSDFSEKRFSSELL